MSTVTLSYPNVIPVKRGSQIGRMLIVISLILITAAVLVIVVSANTDLVDQAPVSQNSITSIPVPTPPIVEVQPSLSATPVPSFVVESQPSISPVPVPTAPLP